MARYADSTRPTHRAERRSNVDRAADAGRLTFGLNLTLDGCCDHREGIADDELHDHFTQLIGAGGAMLYGRKTYELMEQYWPAVARDENAPRADREWARKLEDMPKYVVSASRRDFPWNNSFHVEGDLLEAVTRLKERTPRGVLVGSPMLGAALERLGLIDEYQLVIHPVLAGHGPYLFQGLERSRQLDLVSTRRLTSGATAMHYRRKER
jgi:dihydrofolate reductase